MTSELLSNLALHKSCLLIANNMRIAIIVIVMLSLVHLHGQDPERVITSVDSFPPFVKTVRMVTYAPGTYSHDGSWVTETASQFFELGTDGSWIVRTEVFSDGDISNDSITYDPKTRTRRFRRDNNFEPSTTTTIYNADGTVKSIFIDADYRDDILREFEYDKNKHVRRVTETYADSRKVEDYVYDKTGRLLTVTTSFGSVTDKKLVKDHEVRYQYNSKGRCDLQLELYFGFNDVVRISDTLRMEYDSAGKLISRTEIRQNGQTEMVFEFSYDTAGRLVRKTYHYEDKVKQESGFVYNEWEYDSAGYCSRSSEEGDNYGMTFTWRTTYNEKGLPVQCYYTTGAEVWLYKWEYLYR